MHPYLLRIGQLSIAAYPFLYGLGIAVAGFIAMVLGSQRGLPARRLGTLSLLLAVAIVCGGRAFYVAQHPAEFRDDPAAALDLSEGGQVFYGGLIFALLVFCIFCKATKLPAATVGDALAVGIPLGHAIGRLGCFCRGCCYGSLSSSCWAVRFPKFVDAQGHTIGSPAFLAHVRRALIYEWARLSLPVHPSQLYEAAAYLILFSLLLLVWRKGWLRGRLLAAYITAYACVRFALETVRDNELAFWGLTVPQVVSAAIVPLGIAWLCLARRRSRPATW